MKRLLAGKHLVVDALHDDVVLRVTRTGEAFETVPEMLDAFRQVCTLLDSVGRGRRCLLIDTRGAPPRNDPQFESAFAPVRRNLLSGFRKGAVLVRMTVGVLQVQRHAREDGMPYRPFTHEGEALDWLRS